MKCWIGLPRPLEKYPTLEIILKKKGFLYHDGVSEYLGEIDFNHLEVLLNHFMPLFSFYTPWKH